MKLISLFCILSILLLIACQQLVTEPSPTSELPLSLSLQPALDNGFDVTAVLVTITKDEFSSSLYLSIDDSTNTASGTFSDLQPGIYTIYVEVFDDEIIIATGSGTGEVIADETTTVEIILEFVPTTGNLEIIVEWGNLIPDLPQRVLFIGNSITYYNGGVDLHTMDLANSIDSTLAVVCDNVTFGGWTLEQHFNSPNTIQTIEEGDWDLVILQEMTSRPVTEPELFYEYAALLDSVITQSGAQTVFFFSWPFESVFDEMIEQQSAAYNFIGNELNALVIPVARAWQISRQQDPDLQLFIDDGNHPNYHGTYLASCAFFAFLWGETPVGASYVNDPSITDDEALFLQTIAWETYDIYGQ
ncbi:MAG: SGNH/GDSL hydrolase family protein [Candidatus Cloacimonetes bacterium]|nr:SGNH/GDSL hydrolase family protein [Candidatus Cloacimonadota bacterium]